MAPIPQNITITISEDALREQVKGLINEELRFFAMRLRMAADVLDDGDFWRHQDEMREQAYKDAFEAGKKSVDGVVE